MAKYLQVHSSGIKWNISRDSSSQYRLKSISDLAILNPFHYSKAYTHHDMLSGPCVEGTRDNFIIHTRGIILKSYEKNVIDFNKLDNSLTDLYRYLRFESMQVSIQSNNNIVYISGSDYIQHGQIAVDKHRGMTMRSAYFKTLVTWDNIKHADKKFTKRYEIPVYDEMMLEAYKALIDKEYKKTILFSVIATESLLSTTYYKIFEQKTLKSNKDKKLRIIKNRDGTYKDPILKYLLDRNDFKKLLHEVPLYLMNKSILIDNELLYQNLDKLYNTRNKIVHGNAIIYDPEKLVSVDTKGAELAMRMTIETFNWFGITRYNIFLKNNLIKIN